MIEQAKVPILKETGVTLPFVSASNYRGWILCDRSLSEEAPLLCVVPLLFTATGCLVLFLYPDPVINLLKLIGGSGP